MLTRLIINLLFGAVKQEVYARNPSPSIMSPMGFIVQRSRGGADSYPSSYSDYEESVGPVSTTKPVPIWLCVLLVVSYIIGKDHALNSFSINTSAN